MRLLLPFHHVPSQDETVTVWHKECEAASPFVLFPLPTALNPVILHSGPCMDPCVPYSQAWLRPWCPPPYTLSHGPRYLCAYSAQGEEAVLDAIYTRSHWSHANSLWVRLGCDGDSSKASARSPWVSVIVPKAFCSVPCQARWALAVFAEAEALSMSGFSRFPQPCSPTRHKPPLPPPL